MRALYSNAVTTMNPVKDTCFHVRFYISVMCLQYIECDNNIGVIVLANKTGTNLDDTYNSMNPIINATLVDLQKKSIDYLGAAASGQEVSFLPAPSPSAFGGTPTDQ